MRKLASATVLSIPPIGPQLQLVRGGDSRNVVVPPDPSLKSERVQ
jgi:hypothetical protein